MLQEIRVLLVDAEEAIHRLVSVKVRIAAKLARQVAEAPGKTLGAKKRKALSRIAQDFTRLLLTWTGFTRRSSLGMSGYTDFGREREGENM